MSLDSPIFSIILKQYCDLKLSAKKHALDLLWVPISGLLFGFSGDKWDQTCRGWCWTGASDVAAHTQWECKSALVSVRRLEVLLFHWKYIYRLNVTGVAFYNSAQHILYRLECGIFQRLIVYYLTWRMNSSSHTSPRDCDCAKPPEQCYAGCASAN